MITCDNRTALRSNSTQHLDHMQRCSRVPGYSKAPQFAYQDQIGVSVHLCKPRALFRTDTTLCVTRCTASPHNTCTQRDYRCLQKNTQDWIPHGSQYSPPNVFPARISHQPLNTAQPMSLTGAAMRAREAKPRQDGRTSGHRNWTECSRPMAQTWGQRAPDAPDRRGLATARISVTPFRL
jgi:hypothetical protein